MKLVHRDVTDLSVYHKNPRKGDVNAIRASLERNGQYRPIVVNKGTHTGRPWEVLAGNHTLMAARTLGWKTIATVEVDVDDEKASRIVIADNRTADLGDYDQAILTELLESLPDLDGTGYDTTDNVEKAVRHWSTSPKLENVEAGVVTIGGYVLRPRPEEIAELSDQMEAWLIANGTTFGFIGSLMPSALDRLAS